MKLKSFVKWVYYALGFLGAGISGEVWDIISFVAAVKNGTKPEQIESQYGGSAYAEQLRQAARELGCTISDNDSIGQVAKKIREKLKSTSGYVQDAAWFKLASLVVKFRFNLADRYADAVVQSTYLKYKNK